MSDNLKVGDLVKLLGTNDKGEPLFVGESDLASCVGWVFIITSVAGSHMDYQIFGRPHPMYSSASPKSLKNGVYLKHEEVELIDNERT